MSSENSKYQIFISSTFLDLQKERSAIVKVILDLYNIPIGMEMFSADNEEQWETIKTTINNSDYYLLLIGHRYGSMTPEGISYTEKEFDYALEKGIPVLTYIRNRDVPTSPNQRDEESKKIKNLANFIKKAENGRMCEYWNDLSDLSTKVAIALPKIIRRNPGIGWTRSNKINSIETSKELTRLSKENRELRKEIEYLKESENKKKVDFELSINIPNTFLPISLQYTEPIYRKLKPIDIDKLPSEYQNDQDIEDFKEYNRIIESNLELFKKYNEELEFYYTFESNTHSAEFSIKNTGKRKANDVHIDVIFPPEIIINHSNYNIKEPEIPLDLKSPLEEKILSKNPTLKSLQKLNLLKPNTEKSHDILDSILVSSLHPSKYDINKATNTISYRIDKAIHTKIQNLKGDFKITTFKPGNYNIKIEVICEELEQPLVKEIELKVEKRENLTSEYRASLERL